MRIVIATVGTRGDVQPYVALGQELVRAGHTVRVLTDAIFAALVEGAGLELFPIHTDPRRTLEAGLRQVGPRSWRLMRWFFRQMQASARRYFMDALDACRGADLVLFSAMGFPAAHTAEALGLPYIGAYLQPATPTHAFSSPLATPPPYWLPLKSQYNWLSFRLTNWMLSFTVRSVINRCRQEILGLPPKPWRFYASVDISNIPILYGFSPHVIPRPPDWGPWIHVVGYWFLDNFGDWQPARELAVFLDAGPPPVYVGFGSMIDVDAEHLTQVVIRALEETGQRGILLGGWTRLGSTHLPPNILRVEEVPHAWLFPRCAAVVHHGGAGTTAAGLRAGVPHVVMPFYFDQPFWARRIYDLGVGPAPIPRRLLTAERLAKAIHAAVTDTHMRQRARALGYHIRQEDGVAQAVEVLRNWVGKKAP